jgi:hypothetical protein
VGGEYFMLGMSGNPGVGDGRDNKPGGTTEGGTEKTGEKKLLGHQLTFIPPPPHTHTHILLLDVPIEVKKR